MPVGKSRRIVICVDGTWNSTYAKSKRDDGTDIAKPSNVLKLARAVTPVAADGTTQIVYYDTGIGGEVDNAGGSRFFKQLKKKSQGAWGLGFNVNVEEAVTFLANNCQPGGQDEILVYGFSRGAATARAIVKFIDWMGGVPKKGDAYYIPELFEKYQEGKARRSCDTVKRARGLYIGGDRNRPRFQPFTKIRIKVLGLWDTVYALGGQLIRVGNLGFHVDQSPPSIVDNAYHALAVDETRGPFAPAIWQSHAAHQNMVQMWFPGVHSNIGGGYVKDGMANVALRWMVGHSECHGLEVDETFLSFYHPHGRDRLYKSSSIGYRATDFVLSKKSGRNFMKLSKDVAQQFHPSILDRMLATKQDLKVAGMKKNPNFETDLYEPTAVRALLKAQDDPIKYCEAWYEQDWYPGVSHSLDDKTRAAIRRLVTKRLGLP